MKTPHDLQSLSAAQRQRLAFIEFRIWFFGEVARKQILERFDVATAVGTRDLALYKELAPHNMRYEHKRYCYELTFSPLFKHEVHKVLAALTTQACDTYESVLSQNIPFGHPKPLNQPDLSTLATVTRAICSKQVLSLTYHSMKEGASPRVIIPHAIVDSGLRWHVRAFDRSRGHFRDLVLTRMDNLQVLENAPEVQDKESAKADLQWQMLITLHLVPHPSHPHPEVIAKDFGMTDALLKVTVQAAMAGYVLRQWQVDCSPDAHLRGPEYRLALSNLDYIRNVTSAVLAPGYMTESSSIC